MLLEVFHFGDKSIRIVMINGEPWWIAKDVCDTLGLSNVSESLRRLDEDEKGISSTDTPSGEQQMAIVNEPGLYTLVLSSRKAEAKAFKRWVTHEVLPSIRKTGAYGMEKMLNDPAFLRKVLLDHTVKVEALTARVQEMKPKEQFHDSVGKAINAQTVQEVAKILDWGPNRLFTWLRDNKYFMRNNVPYQEYLDQKLFRLVERVRYTPENEPVTYTRPLITGKGVQHLFKKIGKPLPLEYGEAG